MSTEIALELLETLAADHNWRTAADHIQSAFEDSSDHVDVIDVVLDWCDTLPSHFPFRGALWHVMVETSTRLGSGERAGRLLLAAGFVASITDDPTAQIDLLLKAFIAWPDEESAAAIEDFARCDVGDRPSMDESLEDLADAVVDGRLSVDRFDALMRDLAFLPMQEREAALRRRSRLG